MPEPMKTLTPFSTNGHRPLRISPAEILRGIETFHLKSARKEPVRRLRPLVALTKADFILVQLGKLTTAKWFI